MIHWPWQPKPEEPDPREAQWDETDRRQRAGIDRERVERRAVEARIDAILHDFEALADPRLIRRLRGH